MFYDAEGQSATATVTNTGKCPLLHRPFVKHALSDEINKLQEQSVFRINFAWDRVSKIDGDHSTSEHPC